MKNILNLKPEKEKKIVVVERIVIQKPSWKKETFKVLGGVLVAGTIVYLTSFAGSLTPSATPSAEGFTLGDIFNKLTTGANATAGNHALSTSTTPSSTFHTLTEIYNSIPGVLALSSSTTTVPTGINISTTTLDTIDPNLTASNIKSGATIFGIAGSYGGGGGSSLTWQPDPNLSLCWDSNSGCSVGSGLYDVNGDGSLGLGAVEYCQYLDANGTTVDTSPQNIWRLPNNYEMLKGMNDSYALDGPGTPGGFQGSEQTSGESYTFEMPNNYWVSDVYASDSTQAWSVNYSGYDYGGNGYGGANNYTVNKSYQFLVRCVR